MNFKLRLLLGVLFLAATAYVYSLDPASGVIMAVAGVQGAASRATIATTREDTDYARGILLLERNINPLTLLTMDMGHESVDTIDFHWFEKDLVGLKTQINNGAGYTSVATALVVDDASIFVPGDLAKVADSNEVMLVTASVVATNTITVTRDYGVSEGWTALKTALVDNDFLINVGSVYQQGFPTPVIKRQVEVDTFNYCGDIRTALGWSDIVDMSRLRGERESTIEERAKAIEHAERMELMNFWGKPYAGDKVLNESETYAVGASVAGGVNHFIETAGPAAQKLDESEITQDEFQDFLENVFEFGSGIKWCYTDPALRTAIDKWGISKLNTFTTEEVFGMKVGRWLSSHGEVVFVTHKLLKQPQSGEWKYSFFLDMDVLGWRTLRNGGMTSMTTLDVRRASGKTLIKKELRTIQGIKFGQAARHARLRFKTFAL